MEIETVKLLVREIASDRLTPLLENLKKGVSEETKYIIAERGTRVYKLSLIPFDEMDQKFLYSGEPLVHNILTIELQPFMGYLLLGYDPESNIVVAADF